MKKFISVLALGLSLALGVQAQIFQSSDFLKGHQSFYFTNNTALKYGDAAVGYTLLLPQGQTTNSLATITNISAALVYSLTNTYTTNFENPAPPTYFTNSNNYYDRAWYDVVSKDYGTGGGIWSDKNGNVAATSLGVIAIGTTARSTNTIVIVVTKLIKNNYDGTLFASTATPDKWTFQFGLNGVTGVGVCTNVPVTLLQGAAGLRVVSVTPSDALAASSGYITALQLNGFQP